MQPKVNYVELEAELCRRSFYEFVCSFWDSIIPDPFTDNWHILTICNELQQLGTRVIMRKEKAYDLIINVPPGTSKSTLITIMYPVWLWINDPSLKIITASYSDSLSTNHSVKSRDLLKSEKFQKLFPLIKFKQDSDNKTHYQNNFGGERMATSVGGSVTGLHAHIIVLDDIINAKKGNSEIERNNANYWIDNTISTRKVDKLITPTILVMQRLHESDPTGYLLSKSDKKIKHICLPAEISDDVKPEYLKENYINGLLDPVRLSEQALTDAKIDLGSSTYAGQFQQRPAPEGGGILKKDWFQLITHEDFIKDILAFNKNTVFNLFVDPAYTASKTNDPSGFLSGSWINNQFYISEITEQWYELPELIKFLPEFANRNYYTSKSRIYIEPKASGKSVVQTLKQSNLNVLEAPSPTDDKVTRVHSITAFLEAGKCFLIGSSTTSWINKFLTQAAQFPFGKHDDMIDCLSMALTNKNRVNFTKPKTTNV